MRKAASKGGMILFFISSVVLVRSSGDIDNQNCWSQAIDFYNSFVETACTNGNRDPNQWLPAVCKDICIVEINKSCNTQDGFVKFKLTNGMTSNFVVGDYSFGPCSACHQFVLVIITCKSDGISYTNFTNDNTEKHETDSTTISTSPHTIGIHKGYLVLAALLGLVFGILVTLGVWLIKSKFVKSKSCVSQGLNAHHITYNLSPRSSNSKNPTEPSTNEVYRKIDKRKFTKTKDDVNIYNHLHETRINSDFNDNPYDHAQCLTEIQSTPKNVLEDNYTQINKLR